MPSRTPPDPGPDPAPPSAVRARTPQRIPALREGGVHWASPSATTELQGAAVATPRPGGSSLAEVVTRHEIVNRSMRVVEDLVYTDPIGARRALYKLEDSFKADDERELQVRRLAIRGNVANQLHEFGAAASHFEDALALADGNVRPSRRCELMSDAAGVLINLGEYAQAAELLDKAKELATLSGSERAWWAHVREGFLQLHLNALEEALASFADARHGQPALDPARQPVSDAYYAAMLYAGYGRVYSLGGELGRSIESYAAVVRHCAAFNMRGRLPYHYLDLGRALMAAGEREDAVRNFELTIRTAGDQDKPAVAAASANLGYYAFQAERWEEAGRRFDEAEHHYRTSSNPPHSDLSMVHLWRARMARARGRVRYAGRALVESFEEAKLGVDRSQVAVVAREIAEFYAARGLFEEAYGYFQLFERVDREVREAQSQRRLSELELRHELEERRRESQLYRLKAARLQLKALRAQMNPHFIFNALNSIQETITSERSTEAAVHLAHFARLMRQSLDYSERDTITLEEEVGFLDDYLALNRTLRFAEGFTYAIDVADDLEDDLITLPAMLVQPYVENAIEHGVRLVDDGHIEIRFSSPPDDEDVLQIVIADNGIGREAARKRRRAHSPPHQSMGTTITRNRLELLNRGAGRRTAVSYEDLRGDDGAARGTRVTIELPIEWRE